MTGSRATIVTVTLPHTQYSPTSIVSPTESFIFILGILSELHLHRSIHRHTPFEALLEPPENRNIEAAHVTFLPFMSQRGSFRFSITHCHASPWNRHIHLAQVLNKFRCERILSFAGTNGIKGPLYGHSWHHGIILSSFPKSIH